MTNNSFFKYARVCFALAFGCSFLFVGCKKKDAQEQPVEEAAQGDQQNQANAFPTFSTEISSLSEQDLAALGAPNGLPTEYVFPGAYLAQVLYPERLASVEGGKVALEFFAKSSFQLPMPEILDAADLVLYSKGFTFETLKEAKTDAVIQEGFPSQVEAVYVRSKTALDKDAIRAKLFDKVEPSKCKKEQLGKSEVEYFENSLVMPLDQTGQNLGKIEKICAGLAFPTDDSLVIATGAFSALQSYFGDKTGDERGIAAQRLARTNLDSIAVAFQYDYDFSVPNAQLVQLPVPITGELMQLIAKNVAAFQFLFDVATPDGDFLKATINAKSPESAEELRKAMGTALMQGVDNLNKVLEQNKEQETGKAQIQAVVDLLKSINLSVEGQNLVGSLKNTPSAVAFFKDSLQSINDLRANSEVDAKYGAVQESLSQLGRAFIAYLGKNKTYPAPICADDGTPLLSWRVALLPVLGEQYQKLYEQFKLDEPWNSENNLKLLDQIPAIYKTPVSATQANATQFLIFNAPGTPFGNFPKGLKIQDVADPSRTLSVVLASEKHAVEWTRPESFELNAAKPTETFGEFVCAVTLMGEIVLSKCDDSEASCKTIASIVLGTPQEEEKTQDAPKEPASETTEVPTEAAQPETIDVPVEPAPETVE